MTDWQSVFSFDIPVLETVVRGTVMYFFLLLLMRLNKRDAGEVGMADVLVIVVLADAAQNGMAGEYNSVASGMLLVATIVFWDYAIDWITYRFPVIDKMLQPKQVCLVRDGRIQHKGLQGEMMTKDELLEQLRIEGVDDVKKAKRVYMESNGKISVIKYKG